MIVPFIMRFEFEPDGTKPARQTASFTSDSGLKQTLEMRRSEELIFEDFVGELMIAYVFDLPSYFQHVNRQDCLDFGIRHDELRALSARNLVHRRPKPTVKQGQACVMFVVDQNLESSLLLVDLLWDKVEQQLAGETVVAVPARDVILATGTEVPGGIESLEHVADRAWQRAERRLQLTRSLLVRRDKSWHLFDRP
jgi:uncharacterized protein YtpQ (UPF0354 family)